MQIRVLAVSVARPRAIGIVNGAAVLSGIGKRLVTSANIMVRATNLDGDEQADLRVHGGRDKAVYAYPSEHWPWWGSAHRLACSPAAFGENLTLSGAEETEVAIGDRFRWGEALLEVSQPRAPCYKLAIHTGHDDAPQSMTLSGRCGWYLRVIEEGLAPIDDATLERVTKSDGPSVRESFFAATSPTAGPELKMLVAAAPALSQAWRQAVERKLR